MKQILIALAIFSLGGVASAQTITNASWSFLVDNDTDGYTRSRRLNYTVTSTQSVSAVLRVYVYLNGVQFRSYESNLISIQIGTLNYSKDGIGTSSTTGELPNDFYDFRIELHRADNGNLLAWRDYTNDGDLNLQQFETAAEDVSQPTATLTITVQNVSGGAPNLPGNNGIVRLFNSSNQQIGGDWPTVTNVATITNVPYGNGYYCKVFHNPSNPTTPFGQEYWGQSSSFNISTPSVSQTFTRNQPYGTIIKVYNGTTDVTGQTVPPNTLLTLKYTLNNPSGSAQSAKAKVLVDQSKSDPIDFPLQGSLQSIPGNSSIVQSMTFTPSTPGDYYAAGATDISTTSTPTYTDGGPWTSTAIITVSQPTATLTITVQNVPGGASGVPGSNAFVKLYNSSNQQVGSDQYTNAQAVATFTSVLYGNGYYYKVFHNPNRITPTTPFGTEYWGQSSSFNISTSSVLQTFTRNQPYGGGVNAYINETNQLVTGGTIPAGTNLRIEWTLRNPNTTGATQQSVKGRILIDLDRSPSWDFDLTNDYQAIPVGGSVVASYLCTPQSAGAYYQAGGVITNVNNTVDMYTDGSAWSTNQPLFTVASGQITNKKWVDANGLEMSQIPAGTLVYMKLTTNYPSGTCLAGQVFIYHPIGSNTPKEYVSFTVGANGIAQTPWVGRWEYDPITDPYYLFRVLGQNSGNLRVTHLFQGPATGMVLGGLPRSTNDFANVPFGDVSSPHEFITHKHADIPYYPMHAGLPKPLGPLGSNEVTDRGAHPLNGPSSLSQVISFDGLSRLPTDAHDPPDPVIAVGPNNIIVCVNNSFAIFDKDGNRIKTIDAPTWFNNVVGYAYMTDPKVVFDHHSGRWIILWLDSFLHSSTFLISVSDDSDPIGTWYNFALPANDNGSTPEDIWADYPDLGVDNERVYLTGAMYDDVILSNFKYCKIRVLEKNQLYANNGGQLDWKDIWDLRYPSDLSIPIRPARAAITWGTPGVEYFISDSRFTPQTFVTILSLSKQYGFLVLSAANVSVTQYAHAPNAQQRDGNNSLLNTGDTRFLNLVYRAGYLWTAHTVADASLQFSRARYLCLDPIGLSAIEDISYGASSSWYYYPAVMVDAGRNLMMVFNRSSSSQYAGAYATRRFLNDPPGLGDAVEIKAGLSAITDPANLSRWGDYNGIALDPSDATQIWMVGEYAKESPKTWGTRIAHATIEGLPIQLASFTGHWMPITNYLALEWTTISEVNNYGFWVQRHSVADSVFVDVSNSFVPGHGTTNEPHHYQFLDSTITSGSWFYRLKQIDLDGSVHFTEAIQVERLTEVAQNPVPSYFTLNQNYPNPFNPSTTIEFALPKESHVKLEVYNVLGQRVVTLVNEIRPVGYYAERFNASGLASGFYLYRISAGDFVKVRKLVLMK